MPFRTPSDPEAIERWKAIRRAQKEQCKAQAATDPRIQAMKAAAKERQRAAYERAKERKRAALAATKERPKAAHKKAKELRSALDATRKSERLERGQAKRDVALIRKHVRPATTSGSGTTSPALATVTSNLRRRTEHESQPLGSASSARAPDEPRPAQLALVNLSDQDD